MYAEPALRKKREINYYVWNCSEREREIHSKYFHFFTRPLHSVVLNVLRVPALLWSRAFAYFIPRVSTCLNRIPVWQYKACTCETPSFSLSSVVCIVLFQSYFHLNIRSFSTRRSLVRSFARSFARSPVLLLRRLVDGGSVLRNAVTCSEYIWVWATFHACHAVIRSNA